MSGDTRNEDPRNARHQQLSSAQKTAWEQTLKEMEALAEGRREDGWDVRTFFTIHTDTVSRDMGDHDDFGLFHILPDNQADDFNEWFDAEEFSEYLAYGSSVEGNMFVAIEFIDADTERSTMLACRYDMTRAEGLMASVQAEGVLYSHVKTIDGTMLGRFTYEEYAPLLERPE